MTVKMCDSSAERKWFADLAQRLNVEATDAQPPSDQQMIVGQTRLHYLDWGNEGAHPLVFLHGGGLNAHSYDGVCMSLRNDYHCISIDLRGHGDSEWSPVGDYRFTSLAADVIGVADQLGFEQFGLVGMSMGGMAALVLAGEHGDRLSSLVIVDVGPEIQPEGAAQVGDFMLHGQEFDSADELVDVAMTFNPRRNARRLQWTLRQNLRETPGGTFVWKWDPRILNGRDDEKKWQERTDDLWAAVDAIRTPTLVIHGLDSKVFTLDNAVTLVERLHDGRYAAVENAGHNVQGDNPVAMVRELRAFLQTADQSSPQ